MSKCAEYSGPAWSTPVIGTGATSLSPAGYFRIDHVDAPLQYDQLMALKCSDMYRGIGQCEQDCVYLRTLAVDLHSKIRLFLKEWDWENDKMICTAQTAPKGSVLPFDASYCKEACPGSTVECNTCSFPKAGAEGEYDLYTCLSEEDARHAAKLQSYLSGHEISDDQISCNKIYNTATEEPPVSGGENAIEEGKTTTVTFGGKFTSEARFGLGDNHLYAGATFESEWTAEVESGIRVYSVEGPPYVKKAYAQRQSDKKLFECNLDYKNSGNKARCEDIYELSFHNQGMADCLSGSQHYSACKDVEIGEGRAFFECSASMNNLDAEIFSGEAGGRGDMTIIFGGSLDTMVSSSYGTVRSNAIVGTSKKFNAGGTTRSNIRKTCERWTEHWKSITVANLKHELTEVNNTFMIPSTWDEWSKKTVLRNENSENELECGIDDLNGREVRKVIKSVSMRRDHSYPEGASNSGSFSGKSIAARTSKPMTTNADPAAVPTDLSETEDYVSSFDFDQLGYESNTLGVLRVTFTLDERRFDNPRGSFAKKRRDVLNDLTKKDSKYPHHDKWRGQDWFEVNFTPEMARYMVAAQQQTLTPEIMLQFLNKVGDLKRERSRLRNCILKPVQATE